MTIYEEICETFAKEKIGATYTTAEIKEMVFEKFGRNKGSVIPSDLCYNSLNYGVVNTDYHKNHPRLFLKIDKGVYKYVGVKFDASKVNQYEFGTVNR